MLFGIVVTAVFTCFMLFLTYQRSLKRPTFAN